jgi:hypothetical protein
MFTKKIIHKTPQPIIKQIVHWINLYTYSNLNKVIKTKIKINRTQIYCIFVYLANHQDNNYQDKHFEDKNER